MLIHLNSQRIALSHKQVHKVRSFGFFAHVLFEGLHERRGQTQSPVAWSDRHSRHVTMPQFVLPFRLAEEVSHDGSVVVVVVIRRWSFGDEKRLGPLGHVRHVKVHVVRFRERIQIDIVELQKVVEVELADSCHFDGRTRFFGDGSHDAAAVEDRYCKVHV